MRSPHTEARNVRVKRTTHAYYAVQPATGATGTVQVLHQIAQIPSAAPHRRTDRQGTRGASRRFLNSTVAFGAGRSAGPKRRFAGRLPSSSNLTS
ncbi:hypothetical protein NUW54_g12107 [Trametes sanguinea]|uniref:Uncharacterized protein n=1 Tax=Trametes sanguinea TaxID=158606 RepID=A0ACC1N439_9APHY|nr:hypothetical protein NUW54_g12107 [Trametes sanguinea]